MGWNTYNGPMLTLARGDNSVHVVATDTSNGQAASCHIQRTTGNGAEPGHVTHTGESATLSVRYENAVPIWSVQLDAEIYPESGRPLLHIVTDAGNIDAPVDWGDFYGTQGGLTVYGHGAGCDYLTGLCEFIVTGGTPQSCTVDYTSALETADWEEVVTDAYTYNALDYQDTGLNNAATYWYRARTEQQPTPESVLQAARWTRGSSAATESVDDLIGTVYRIHDGSSTTRTGTVTLNGTTAVVGSGTAFNSEFRVGDVIEVNGEARRITVITDNENLTVNSAFAQSLSAQVYSGYQMVRIMSLAVDMLEPNSTPQTYSAARALLDGTVRGLGWSVTEWKWGFLTADQRNALKALCAGKSVLTFIDTRDDADEFATYRAVMVWPERTEIYSHHWINFVLAFRKMESI